MLIYVPTFLLSFISLFYAKIFKNRYIADKKKSNLLIFISLGIVVFLLLAIVSTLRYGIGVDYFYSDNRTINFMREGLDVKFDEPFINIFVNVMIRLNLPNQFFFLTLGIITVGSYVLSILFSKDKNYLLQFFILIFYCIFFNSLNQSRNGTAIALGLLAFSILYNFNKKWYVILISYIIGCGSVSFHNSGLINLAILTVYIIFYFLNNKLSNKILLTIYAIVIALSPVLFIILYFTIDKIPILNNFAYFFSYNFDFSGTPLIKFLGGFFSFIIPMISLVFYLMNFSETKDYFLKFIGFVLFLNILFMVIGLLTNSLLLCDRLKSTLYVFELFIIPYMFKKLPKDNQRFIYLGSISFILVVICFSSQVSNGTYPYRSILNPSIYIY